MTRTHICPTCGRTVDPAGTGCPACLLKLALDAPAEGGDGASGGGATPRRRKSFGTGSAVGPYRVVRELGEGGMGVVYLAEQTEPIERRVALKVIKQGMDSEQVVRRFEAERQALALMDHPTVARVFEAGQTEGGLPYFAMEYIEGEPITSYCDRRRLDVTQRLQLFTRVCDGLQHAHQRGIIHRDVKPSNVMITEIDGEPYPKIIDFGVAKATGPSPTGPTARTAIGVLLGTPEYMSPEQADLAPADLDTRTDVYSLGVVLYELLTGVTPLDSVSLESASYEETRRRVREVRPPRPSVRVARLDTDRASAVASARRCETPALRRRLSGDLDLIATKALEKERDMRYGSPAELAADIRRHLGDQPILARPPSFLYYLRKTAARNRLASALAAALVLLALGATIVTFVQLGRTRAERDRATREAQTARAVSDFLNELFAVADPYVARGREIAVRDVMDRGAERIEEDLAGQPRVQARLMLLLGSIYRRLGMPEEALDLVQRGIELAGNEVEGDPRFATDLYLTLAWIHRDAVRLDEASLAVERATAIAGEKLEPGDPLRVEAVTLTGAIQRDRGEYDEARRTLEQALALVRSTGAEESEAGGWVWFHLGWLEHELGQDEAAVEAYERGCAILETSLPKDAPGIASCYNDYSRILQALRRYDEAEQRQRQALGIWQRVLPDDHPKLAEAHNVLGSLAFYRKDYERAEQNYRAALDIRRQAFGESHPDVGSAMFNIGLVHRAAGRFDEAESWMERGLAVTEAAKGADHPDVVNSLFALAPLYERRGRLEQALSLYDRAVTSRERTHGPDHLWTAGALRSRGNTELALGRYEEACEDLRRADGIAASMPSENPGRLSISLDLARCEARSGRTVPASELLDAIAAIPQRDGVEDEVAAYAAYLRAWIARAEGRDGDADDALERALSIRRSFEEAPSANALYVEAVRAAHRGEGERAVARLTAAVDAGFPPWLVDFEVDFAPIRERDDLPQSLRERRAGT